MELPWIGRYGEGVRFLDRRLIVMRELLVLAVILVSIGIDMALGIYNIGLNPIVSKVLVQCVRSTIALNNRRRELGIFCIAAVGVFLINWTRARICFLVLL